MRKLNFKQIICGLAFLGLAGFSCFWTAESLYIWQPDITLPGAWMLAIVFYIIASMSFSRLLLSLNKNEYFGDKLGGRGGQFLLGLIGLIVFWLVISLPTNTHTLLYRATVGDVIKTDLTRTQGYLQGLKDNNVEIKKINNKYNSRKEAVDALILRMIFETKNPSAVGIGHRFETILLELETVLGTDIQRAANVGSTPLQWLATVNYYQEQANAQLKLYRAECDKDIEQLKNMMNSKTLADLIANCGTALGDIENMNGVNNDIIAAATKDLSAGYAYIKTNSKYIEFSNDAKGKADKERYTREGATPEVKELLSVSDVWKDFLTTDKYKGHGFIFWVFIALLVDISAFTFFNITFNKKN